jgi:alcohol dehydrogenase class IV
MDALTHAIEALTSTLAQPICDGLALQAIRLIRANLPLVIADGSNEQARLNMAIGATLAGQAFTVAQVGLAHSMSHTMGVLNHVHHGTACGIVLPKVMRFNVDHAGAKLAADEIESLMQAVGHPTRLRDIGVPDGDFHMAAFHAVADTPTLFNARPVTGLDEVMALFEEAY